MVLNTLDKQVCIFHEEEIQLLVTFQCPDMEMQTYVHFSPRKLAYKGLTVTNVVVTNALGSKITKGHRWFIGTLATKNL